MKKEKKSNSYGPNERGFLKGDRGNLEAYSDGEVVNMPNNIVDPIVTNNITNAEMDYTVDSQLESSPKQQKKSKK